MRKEILFPVNKPAAALVIHRTAYPPGMQHRPNKILVTIPVVNNTS
jgi:hypothetical protein